MEFIFQSRRLYEDRQKNRPKVVCGAKNKITFATPYKNKALIGEMAEWSNAVVLKTTEGHTSGGSNPSLSALIPKSIQSISGFFMPSASELRLKKAGHKKYQECERSEDSRLTIMVSLLGSATTGSNSLLKIFDKKPLRCGILEQIC
jgi:hypothetical protein